MLRSAASKVMWVGRATVFLIGLSVILALLFGVASTVSAHTGSAGLFHLNHNNPVKALSKLTGNLAGKVLQVTNSGTANGSAAIQANNKSPVSPAIRAINSGGGPALGLGVGAGKAPLTVNASAGKATNLNADKLDGKDESAFLGKTEKAADSAHADQADNATNAGNADTVDGKHAAEFAAAAHAHAGEDITSGTVAEPRIAGTLARDTEIMPTVKANDGAGSGVDSDKLDGYDSKAFGIKTLEATAAAYNCDTSFTWNQCAPVTVTVPSGQTYRVSVWSSFSAKAPGFTSREVSYCSGIDGSGVPISYETVCLANANKVRVHDYFTAASSSGDIQVGAGTYTFYTGINPSDAFDAVFGSTVITKVMVRDAYGPQP